MKPIPPGSPIVATALLVGAALVMAIGGCRKSAGTAQPLKSTRVCSGDAGRKDVSRSEAGLDTASGETGKDGGAADTDSGKTSDGPVAISNNDAPDSSRDLYPSYLDAPDGSDSRGEIGGATGAGGTSTETGGTGGATGTGGSGGTGGLGTIDGGPDTRDAPVADTRDAPVADAPAADTQDASIVDAVPDTQETGSLDSALEVHPDMVVDGNVDRAIDVPPDQVFAPSDAVDVPQDVITDVVADAPQPDAAFSDGSNSDGSDPEGCTTPSWAEIPSSDFTAMMPALDKDGNIFVASTFYADKATGLDLGLVAPVPSAAGANLLVGRISSANGSFVWAKSFGDDSDQIATGTAVDKSGRVGVVGTYQGTMTFNTDSLQNPGTTQFAFIAALSSDGTALWGKSVDLGGTGTNILTIAAHPNFDDFVVCGHANNAAPSLVTGFSPDADGLKDIIVAKINGSDGSIVWSRLIGGTTPTVGGPGNQTCDAVAIADDGNVFIGGGYLGTIDFGSGAFPEVTGVLNVQPWVAKLDRNDGHTLYATSFQMVGTKGRADIHSLAVDASGNVVIGGQLTRGPMAFGAYTLTPSGTDAFAAKLDPSLTVLWAKSWGDAAVQDLKGLSVDSAGDVTIVGVLNSTMDLGTIGVLSSAGSADAFLVKLDGADGNATCASSYGDQPGSQQAKSIAIARFAVGADKDTAYVSGVFASEMDFGIPGKAPLQSPSTSENLMFFVRINNP